MNNNHKSNRIPSRDYNRIKIISMGHGGSGKSCLIKRYCEQKFVSRYIATIGVDFGVKVVKYQGKNIKINLWDLSGQPEFYDIRNEFYDNAQVALLVYDITSRKSFQALELWLREATRYAPKNLKIIVCANKSDLTVERIVSTSEGQRWAENRQLPYYEVSAKSGDNVTELFRYILEWTQQN